MKEVVHFTYDIEFIISTGTQIYIEKWLYSEKIKNLEACLIKNKPYSIKMLKFDYAKEKTDGVFDKKIVDLALKTWEQGITITDQHFRQLAIKYLESIATCEFYNLDGDHGSVYDRNEHIEICVKGCDHYDAALYLAVKFIGGPNKLRGMKDDKEFLCDYIHRYINIVSDTTSKASVIRDLHSFFTSISFIENRYEEIRHQIERYIEYLNKEGLTIDNLWVLD